MPHTPQEYATEKAPASKLNLDLLDEIKDDVSHEIVFEAEDDEKEASCNEKQPLSASPSIMPVVETGSFAQPEMPSQDVNALPKNSEGGVQRHGCAQEIISRSIVTAAPHPAIVATEGRQIDCAPKQSFKQGSSPVILAVNTSVQEMLASIQASMGTNSGSISITTRKKRSRAIVAEEDQQMPTNKVAICKRRIIKAPRRRSPRLEAKRAPVEKSDDQPAPFVTKCFFPKKSCVIDVEEVSRKKRRKEVDEGWIKALSSQKKKPAEANVSSIVADMRKLESQSAITTKVKPTSSAGSSSGCDSPNHENSMPVKMLDMESNLPSVMEEDEGKDDKSNADGKGGTSSNNITAIVERSGDSNGMSNTDDAHEVVAVAEETGEAAALDLSVPSIGDVEEEENILFVSKEALKDISKIVITK